MRRLHAFCFGLSLTAGACSTEIVLGDSSDAALPTAGGAPSGGGSSPDLDGNGLTAGSSAAAAGVSESAAGVAGAAGSLEAPILPPGDLVWSTDHEVGDFSDWQKGGAYYGGEYEWGDVNGYVDIGAGRNGSNGVVADINTAARGETSEGLRLYRRIEAGPAYYSAWFKLEEAHAVTDWWSIFLFHARDDSLSLDNDLSMWDVRVVGTPDGGMQLQFFDHDVMQGREAGKAGALSVGKWFEIRAYLDYRPPQATRLVIWLNGTQLFDAQGLHTAVEANVFWSIGNGAARLEPADCTLNMDDAAIHQAGAP